MNTFVRTFLASLLAALSLSTTAHADCGIRVEAVSLPQGKLAYATVGTGGPVVLLHGLFASKEQWHGLMCKLAEAGWQAVAPDLPGYGASSGFPAEDYKLEKQVERLDAFFSALNLPPVQLAGNSMGGAIAELYAARHSDKVKSLALIGAPLGLGGWSPELAAALKQGRNPFIPLTAAAFDEELSLLMVHPPQLPFPYKAGVVADYQSRKAHFSSVFQTVGAYGNVLCKPVHKFAPAVVLWGERDRIFSVKDSGKVATCLPGHKLLILPGAGHLPHLESPEETARGYLAFLADAVKPVR